MVQANGQPGLQSPCEAVQRYKQAISELKAALPNPNNNQ